MGKTRHVYARRNEHVKVHRNYSSDGFEGLGVLMLLGGAVLAIFVVIYIDTIMWCSAIALGGYALVRFRKVIWKFVCWSFRIIWLLITNWIPALIRKVVSWFKKKPEEPESPDTLMPYDSNHPDYGKICKPRY